MLEDRLSPPELSAARWFVWRVLQEVPADLVEAALFGSKARGEARPSSDLDILLVFDSLPPDREPHASMAETIAEQVAAGTGVPVTVWSVSLPDLREGDRTPMLVDALADAIPIWCWPEPLGPVAFTEADAFRCSAALLERVREGSHEFADHALSGHSLAAARRGRDDVIRLATALLLLGGITRPRRAATIDALYATEFVSASPPPGVRLVLDWARLSFGPDGRDDDWPIPPPPGGLLAVTRAIDYLRDRVRRVARTLPARAGHGTPSAGGVY